MRQFKKNYPDKTFSYRFLSFHSYFVVTYENKNTNDFLFLLFFAAKTRTKDKYRVVYSDTQRLELEKEFHYSRYITIRRKAELASILGLSERQVCTNDIPTFLRTLCHVQWWSHQRHLY